MQSLYMKPTQIILFSISDYSDDFEWHEDIGSSNGNYSTIIIGLFIRH